MQQEVAHRSGGLQHELGHAVDSHPLCAVHAAVRAVELGIAAPDGRMHWMRLVKLAPGMTLAPRVAVHRLIALDLGRVEVECHFRLTAEEGQLSLVWLHDLLQRKTVSNQGYSWWVSGFCVCESYISVLTLILTPKGATGMTQGCN